MVGKTFPAPHLLYSRPFYLSLLFIPNQAPGVLVRFLQVFWSLRLRSRVRCCCISAHVCLLSACTPRIVGGKTAGVSFFSRVTLNTWLHALFSSVRLGLFLSLICYGITHTCSRTHTHSLPSPLTRTTRPLSLSPACFLSLRGHCTRYSPPQL